MSEDIHAEALERYNKTAQALWDNLYGWDAVPTEWPVPAFSLFRDRIPRRDDPEQKQLAEQQDRAEWIESIRRRLGLVAEVHRCWVWQSVGLWHWWCLRDSCGGAHHNLPSQPEAFADALAHARAFVPQPPEPEPWAELDVLAFEAAWDAVQEEHARFAAALPGRIAAVTEQVNGTFAGLLPEGMRFEWE